jgi:hypothetical protein
MEEKELTYQVLARMGGSSELFVLFESKNRENCNEVCEDYMKSKRKVSAMARDYMTNWGHGNVDEIFVMSKNA